VSAAAAPLAWLREAPAASRKALMAASLGWMLDSFDVMLYSLVLASLMADLHLTKAMAGVLGSMTLTAAAVGGLCFGLIADRFGRTRALMLSVLLYAVFTAACGLAQGFVTLAVFRVLLGFGMGGEWASGASLVSETWPAEHRGKALGLMQSSWAIGYALAALVAAVVMPVWGWRGVFFVGVLPAFFTIWIRRDVEEPEVWRASRVVAEGERGLGFGALFRGRLLGLTVALTVMNACCLFAWWGFNLWVPAYLSLPVAKGGVGLPAHAMTSIVVFMQVGMWVGYVTFGYISDAFGRKRTYVAYLVSAAALLAVFPLLHKALPLFLLAPCVAFAATGYFSGFAAVTAEVYETRIRSTAQGFTYNTGRLASAAAPFVVGTLADRHGFTAGFWASAGAFLLAAAMWSVIPETGVLPDGPAARGAVIS
jgi:MFS family permease